MVSGRLGVLALVIVVACTPPREDAPVAKAAKPAPAFAAVTLEGDTVTLESLRGRPVLLNLWATWCAPCRRETPYFQRVHARLAPRGLQVVGVSLDPPAAAEDVRDFIAEYGVTYRILRDPQMRGMDVFALVGLPATYLIDADGMVIWAAQGEVRPGEEAFEAALEAALAPKEGTR